MICDKLSFDSYQEAQKVVNKAHKKRYANGSNRNTKAYAFPQR